MNNVITQLEKDIRASGLKKSFIADRLGLKQSTFSMMLKGHNHMPIEIEKGVRKMITKAAAIKA